MTRVLIALLVLVPSLASAQVAPIWPGVRAPVFGLPSSAVNGSGDFTPQIFGPVGNCTTAPAYSFTGDTNTGMSSSLADTLCWVVGGTERLTLGSGGILTTTGSINGPNLDASGLDLWGFLALRTNGFVRIGDVDLSRGASNRLDLATGDSFYVVSGGLGVGVTPPAAGSIQSSGTVITGAGTTAIPPLTVTNGTNLTTATANAVEHDGAAFYTTSDTTNGRRYSDSWNYFRLTGSGTGITSIADFFGSNSAIPLVASGVYEIEWNAYFSQVTAGTATWTVTTATTALANITGEYVCSNIAGIQAVGAPQTAGINTTTSSATAFPVTGTEATAVTHYCRIRVLATAGAGASNTRLRLTMSAGTATPLINSYFRVRRLSGGNVGTFVP